MSRESINNGNDSRTTQSSSLSPQSSITRREAIAAIIGGTAMLATSGSEVFAEEKRERMPAIFLAHGAPPLLDDASWVRELHDWAGNMPRPKAVLMLSAHWEERPVTIGATTTVPLVYDFYGFPKHHYEQKYPAPGAPQLAARIRALLKGSQPVADQPERGLDHGAYVPMVAMYPDADVPTLQISLPSEDPRELFEFGRSLRALRDEGVLIVGSGFITHNLRGINWNATEPVGWAVEFDHWAQEALAKRDIDALLDYRAKAPAVNLALPTHEHFVPLLVALGAADDSDPLKTPISGFWLGSLTRRSIQFG
jgi:4,5-DOPA dioxygenase extradiol